MELLPATSESRKAEVRATVDELFTVLSTTCEPERVFACVDRLEADGYKTAVIPEKGGIVAASTKTPGALYSEPKLKRRMSDAEVVIVWLLRNKLTFPEMLPGEERNCMYNDDMCATAIKIGKARTLLWRALAYIRKEGL